jgi:hypothetical protein
MEALMFNLANLSDAELGALVRKSVGDLVMKQALEGLAEREAAKEAALVERQRLARDENRRRRSLITQPAFKVPGRAVRTPERPGDAVGRGDAQGHRHQVHAPAPVDVRHRVRRRGR